MIINVSALPAISFGKPDGSQEETVARRPTLAQDEKVPAARTARTFFCQQRENGRRLSPVYRDGKPDIEGFQDFEQCIDPGIAFV